MAINLVTGTNGKSTKDMTLSGTTSSPVGLRGFTSKDVYKSTDGNTYKPFNSGNVTKSALEKAIENALNAGLPIVVSVHCKGITHGTHYVVVVGWADSSHSDYKIVDPGKPRSGSFKMNSSKCLFNMKSHPSGAHSLGNDNGTYQYVTFKKK